MPYVSEWDVKALFNRSTIYPPPRGRSLAVQVGLWTRHITTVAITIVCRNATHSDNPRTVNCYIYVNCFRTILLIRWYRLEYNMQDKAEFLLTPFNIIWGLIELFRIVGICLAVFLSIALKANFIFGISSTSIYLFWLLAFLTGENTFETEN